jgi:large subunit ribosomal protein L25
MADVVNANLRGEQQTGTRACRRMRNAGFVPAVLYGHKETVVHLIVKPGEVLSAVKAGHKMIDLKGAVNESALVKKVQWDALGADIVHVDFERVSATELIQTKVTVELRGEAAGVKEGGVLQFITHELDIECPAGAIPERIIVTVKELQLDGEIFARDVPLPEGVKLAAHADDVIVSCSKPMTEEEEAAALAAAGPAEPELIRKEKAEGEEAEEKK